MFELIPINNPQPGSLIIYLYSLSNKLLPANKIIANYINVDGVYRFRFDNNKFMWWRYEVNYYPNANIHKRNLSFDDATNFVIDLISSYIFL